METIQPQAGSIYEPWAEEILQKCHNNTPENQIAGKQGRKGSLAAREKKTRQTPSSRVRMAGDILLGTAHMQSQWNTSFKTGTSYPQLYIHKEGQSIRFSDTTMYTHQATTTRSVTGSLAGIV